MCTSIKNTDRAIAELARELLSAQDAEQEQYVWPSFAPQSPAALYTHLHAFFVWQRAPMRKSWSQAIWRNTSMTLWSGSYGHFISIERDDKPRASSLRAPLIRRGPLCSLAQDASGGSGGLCGHQPRRNRELRCRHCGRGGTGLQQVRYGSEARVLCRLSPHLTLLLCERRVQVFLEPCNPVAPVPFLIAYACVTSLSLSCKQAMPLHSSGCWRLGRGPLRSCEVCALDSQLAIGSIVSL